MRARTNAVNELWYSALGACPDCAGDLVIAPAAACSCGFAVPDETPLDLRPRSPKMRTRQFAIGTSAYDDLARVPVDRPAVTYSGQPALRDSSELFSAAEPWL